MGAENKKEPHEQTKKKEKKNDPLGAHKKKEK
jgi:hypothetical protein